MIPTARARERDRRPLVATVAHLCALVLAVGCGGGGATPDATVTPCNETAEPHDEDGDGVFDACDNCPATANASQIDSTEVAIHAFPDRVGDACDPRPGGSGDILVELFTFATDPGGWDGWVIDGDAAHASGDAAWTSPLQTTGDGLFVRADVATLAAGSITIALDGDGIGYGHTCTVQADRLDAVDIDAATSSVMLDPPLAIDEPFTLVGWRVITHVSIPAAAKLICRVVRGEVTEETSVMLVDDVSIGSHAISVAQASVALGSVSVYTSPGPKNP